MWGEELRKWFELFTGLTVSRADDPDSEQGWLNWSDVERSISLRGYTFDGRKYDQDDDAQRDAFLDSLSGYASWLCEVKLLERRRKIVPPSLDYRVTEFGRRVDNWGYGSKPGIRKSAFFLAVEAIYRLKKYKVIIAVGAFGWAALNAARFYGVVAEWVGGVAFPVVSAISIALAIAAWGLLFKRNS